MYVDYFLGRAPPIVKSHLNVGLGDSIPMGLKHGYTLESVPPGSLLPVVSDFETGEGQIG